jgi:hypothetical protein
MQESVRYGTEMCWYLRCDLWSAHWETNYSASIMKSKTEKYYVTKLIIFMAFIIISIFSRNIYFSPVVINLLFKQIKFYTYNISYTYINLIKTHTGGH